VPNINISRFFINQDTGGAIKGAARGDLYMGYGDDAEVFANNLHALGDQYLLILKKKDIEND
jgi:membrane-bound lytic murein transglycosylase A